MANPLNSTAYRGNDGRLYVDVTEAKTLALADSGYVQNVIGDVTVTIPATATQGYWAIRNGGAEASSTLGVQSGADGSALAVDCNGSDTFQGLNVSGTGSDGKKLTNTAATSRVGDELVIQNTGQTDGPIIVSCKGIWALEA